MISVNFEGLGMQVVRDSWKFSDPGSPHHLAWEVVEVLYPAGSGNRIPKTAFTGGPISRSGSAMPMSLPAPPLYDRHKLLLEGRPHVPSEISRP